MRDLAKKDTPPGRQIPSGLVHRSFKAFESSEVSGMRLTMLQGQSAIGVEAEVHASVKMDEVYLVAFVWSGTRFDDHSYRYDIEHWACECTGVKKSAGRELCSHVLAAYLSFAAVAARTDGCRPEWAMQPSVVKEYGEDLPLRQIQLGLHADQAGDGTRPRPRPCSSTEFASSSRGLHCSRTCCGQEGPRQRGGGVDGVASVLGIYFERPSVVNDVA